MGQPKVHRRCQQSLALSRFLLSSNREAVSSITPVAVKQSQERRREPRSESVLEMVVTELALGGADRLPATVVDASKGGFRIQLLRRLNTSACLHCEIAVPGSQVSVRTLMQVRWCRGHDGASYDCGLLYVI
jgi:hypothetical protein